MYFKIEIDRIYPRGVDEIFRMTGLNQVLQGVPDQNG